MLIGEIGTFTHSPSELTTSCLHPVNDAAVRKMATKETNVLLTIRDDMVTLPLGGAWFGKHRSRTPSTTTSGIRSISTLSPVSGKVKSYSYHVWIFFSNVFSAEPGCRRAKISDSQFIRTFFHSFCLLGLAFFLYPVYLFYCFIITPCQPSLSRIHFGEKKWKTARMNLLFRGLLFVIRQ